VDAANAEVTVADQALSSASLIAPIAGTVASVDLAAGQSVAAGSSSATITILGPGQHSVSTTIGIADVDLVKKGTTATVTVDGVSKTLPGTVTYIGTLNTSGTSGSTTTYPVTVLLDPTSTVLFDGAGASVALHVGAVTQALTVPTSAIRHTGQLTTVSVDNGGKITTTQVRVGVEGTDRTQIVSGLRAGQRVVLATVSAPVPTGSTQTGRFGARTGLGGGLTGGGLTGGGLTGGGLTGGGLTGGGLGRPGGN
jgi:multidrug efflux pump subunit AcrA (membrane-fusion protein)